MSMWEPRSSHLYVWTGLRVCEWFCVGVGTPYLCPCHGQSGTGCAHLCGPWCARVCSMHMARGYAPLYLAVRASISVCLRYVTLCVARSSVWPVSGHVLAWVYLSWRQLCSATCGPRCVWAHVSAPQEFGAVRPQAGVSEGVGDYPSARVSPLPCALLYVSHLCVPAAT